MNINVKVLLHTLLLALLPAAAHAATVPWGPSEYRVANPNAAPSSHDTPAGFFDFTPGSSTAWIESFELNNVTPAPDPFLTITPGEILAPRSESGAGSPLTDSVDGDDGAVDGSGLDGYSWFAESANDVTVTFSKPVRAAGLVFTDGDPASTKITLEAFDAASNSLGLIDAGDLADDFISGQTEEDRFLGFTDDMTLIKSIKLSMTGGSGIEIDHVHWQEPVPEPAAGLMAAIFALGLAGFRHQRK